MDWRRLTPVRIQPLCLVQSPLSVSLPAVTHDLDVVVKGTSSSFKFFSFFFSLAFLALLYQTFTYKFQTNANTVHHRLSFSPCFLFCFFFFFIFLHFFLFFLFQMAARVCAAGTAVAPWSRVAGAASARLDGVDPDAASSWKLTAVTEPTTTEVTFPTSSIICCLSTSLSVFLDPPIPASGLLLRPAAC